MSKKLLVIDDEPGHRLMVRAVMEDVGWEVCEAASGEEGLSLFSDCADIDVVLVDMKMPGMNGQQTLNAIHAKETGTPVVLLTAYGTVGSAVEAMKQGAFDYLTKPADNDELILTLNRAFEYSCLRKENSRLKTQIAGQEALHAIVGTSPAIRKVHELIQQVGPTEATVLVTGESGTGKELIAQAIHAASTRSGEPLVKVNCAALPGQLLESELFGYCKGAFTGAVKDKPGRFQLANKGTLFLDEIGELPLDLQAKLLRAIQDRCIEPLGSVTSTVVDVRIIAATNRDLRKAVREGKFREDLFFRLNVLEIHSPALRERLEDIPLLVGHLLKVLTQKNKKNVRGVSPAFLQQLTKYSWQGNVRELENMLERAIILSRSDIISSEMLLPDIDSQPIPARTRQNSDSFFDSSAMRDYNSSQGPKAQHAEKESHVESFPEGDTQRDTLAPGYVTNSYQETFLSPNNLSPLDAAEQQMVVKALKENDGHREKTAESLGISRRTLQYKLKKFGLRKRK